jgi:hypothetical protein
MKTMNPLTGEPLRDEASDYVDQLRQVQRNARGHARSGNPAKRHPARVVLARVPRLLRALYVQEAGK